MRAVNLILSKYYIMSWPNFFIVGAPRAGTTSLYQYLKEVPGIFMSSIKEPNYFSVKTIPDKKPYRPVRNTKSYLELFTCSKDEKIIGEASTNYLYDEEAVKLIHEKNPNSRILISLRDPIERAWSHYMLLKHSGWKHYAFSEQIKKELTEEIDFEKPHIRLKAGLYSKDVEKYFELFGRKQVKVIIFEEWIKNVKNTIEDILQFLNIHETINDIKYKIYDPDHIPRGKLAEILIHNSTVNKISNKITNDSFKSFSKKLLSKNQTKQKMSQEDKTKLKKYYIKDVEKLQTLLERDLPWPNFN